MNPQILIDEIKLISARLEALEKRSSPPTAIELAEIVALAKTPSNIKVNLDSDKVGEKLAQYLPKQAEIDGIRKKIVDAGIQAAERIEDAGSKKNSRIAEQLGFLSLKAFLLLSALPILLCGIFLLLWISTRQEREKAQETNQINIDLSDWIKEKHPDIFQKYVKSRETERILK